MEYLHIPPPEHLKKYIRYFWTLDNSGHEGVPKTFGPMADGCPGLIFQAEGEAFLDEGQQEMSKLLVYGQTTRATKIIAAGQFRTIGVYFYPDALKTIFGVNADEYTDTCFDLDAVTQKQGIYLLDQLHEINSLDKKIEGLCSYIFSQIRKNHTLENEAMQFALGQIIASNGNIALKDLQDKLFLTERSFERRFKEHVGITPKLFTRIVRFQSSLQQLRKSDFDKLSDIAFENDYSDQSHFIRVFKEFAGVSPQQYRKNLNEVVKNFPELIIQP